MDSTNNQNYPRAYSSYTLLESIGQGGMSAIDLAQATVTDAQYVRFVVIKRMHAHLGETDDSYIRMFQDEARISAELQHANIAQVYNFGQYDDEFFMVMEYVPGVDLRELQRGLASLSKGLPIRITLKILYDILQALDYAHHRVDTFGDSLNIVHRDVNPRNVMLSIRGEVKLIDFGVAKADNRMDKTVGHTIKGKFAYMAPEQIDPTIGAIDGRADLFAVGLMLYEMVAGQRPFHGLNEIQIMHKIMSVDIPALPSAPDHPRPEQLQAIFQKVMSKSPEDRYETAGKMAMALQQASMACGGLATTAELAQFLKQHLPQRVDTIASRLAQYRTNATLSGTGSHVPIEPRPYVENTNHSIKTLHRPNQKEHDTTFVLEPTDLKDTTSYGWFALGGIVLFAGGFAAIVNLGTPTKQPEISPTKIVTTQRPTSTKVNPKPTDSTKASKDNTPSDEKLDSEANVKKAPKKESKENKEPIKKASSTTKNTTAITAPTSSNSSNTENTPVLSDDNNDNTVVDKREQIQKNEPVAPTTTKPKENTPKDVKPKETVTKPVEPKEVLQTLYLMVGVESGTRGLPVYYKGKEITKTGAKKSVQLPIGSIQIEVRDPKSNTSVFQSVTVQEGDPILTVQIHRL